MEKDEKMIPFKKRPEISEEAKKVFDSLSDEELQRQSDEATKYAIHQARYALQELKKIVDAIPDDNE